MVVDHSKRNTILNMDINQNIITISITTIIIIIIMIRRGKRITLTMMNKSPDHLNKNALPLRPSPPRPHPHRQQELAAKLEQPQEAEEEKEKEPHLPQLQPSLLSRHDHMYVLHVSECIWELHKGKYMVIRRIIMMITIANTAAPNHQIQNVQQKQQQPQPLQQPQHLLHPMQINREHHHPPHHANNNNDNNNKEESLDHLCCKLLNLTSSLGTFIEEINMLFYNIFTGFHCRR